MNDKPKLRWHQLSLRTLLGVTSVTATGLGIRGNVTVVWMVIDLAALLLPIVVFGWWLDRSQSLEQRRHTHFWRSFEKAQEECRRTDSPSATAT